MEQSIATEDGSREAVDVKFLFRLANIWPVCIVFE